MVDSQLDGAENQGNGEGSPLNADTNHVDQKNRKDERPEVVNSRNERKDSSADETFSIENLKDLDDCLSPFLPYSICKDDDRSAFQNGDSFDVSTLYDSANRFEIELPPTTDRISSFENAFGPNLFPGQSVSSSSDASNNREEIDGSCLNLLEHPLDTGNTLEPELTGILDADLLVVLPCSDGEPGYNIPQKDELQCSEPGDDNPSICNVPFTLEESLNLRCRLVTKKDKKAKFPRDSDASLSPTSLTASSSGFGKERKAPKTSSSSARGADNKVLRKQALSTSDRKSQSSGSEKAKNEKSLIPSDLPKDIEEEVLQKKPQKRKQAKFLKPVPSRYCHICARTPKTVRNIVCGKMKTGYCRKVVCERCFNDYGWDWKAANEPESNWICPHCVGKCPKRAQCHTYSKTNNRLRVKRIIEKKTLKNAKKRQQPTAPSLILPATARTDPPLHAPWLMQNLIVPQGDPSLTYSVVTERHQAGKGKAPDTGSYTHDDQKLMENLDITRFLDGLIDPLDPLSPAMLLSCPSTAAASTVDSNFPNL